MKKLITLMLFALTSSAHAQETPDTFRLRDVVVTATRLPQSLTTVSSAVSVIRHQEFQQLGFRNAADVLRTVSGTVLVQSGSYGAFTSMFMRGGESDYVQVLIDGVQINSPGEHFDFAGLSLENIDRIEVVKGPVSVLYGSDAVAGVVQLFTKPGMHRTRAQVRALAGRGDKVGSSASGNFDSREIQGDASGRISALDYSIGISHFNTEGALAFNNEHQLTSGTARLGTTFGSRTNVALSTRIASNRFHYPTDGSGNLVDQNQYQDADALSVGVDAAHRLTRRTELRAQAAWNRNDNLIDDAADTPGDTLGFFAFHSDETFERSSFDVRLNHELQAGTTLTIGGEVENQSQEGSSLAQSSFGDFPGAADNDRSNNAGYVQLVRSSEKLSLQGGLRLDNSEQFGEFLTYRAGASLQLAKMLRVRASLGTGFKEPRFFEQFSQNFGAKGNPALEPEQSRSFELGADAGRGAWTVGATLFAQTFRDLIQYSFTPVTRDSVNYVNVGEVASNGLELESKYVGSALTLRATFTLLDTEVTDAGAGSDPLYQEGERLVRRPKQTASLAITYGRSFNVGAIISYVGKRDDLFYDETFTAQRVGLPAYTKVDATLRSPSFSGVRGMLKIENVLDEEYQEIRGFPARGRVVFVGVTFDR